MQYISLSGDFHSKSIVVSGTVELCNNGQHLEYYEECLLMYGAKIDRLLLSQRLGDLLC